MLLLYLNVPLSGLCVEIESFKNLFLSNHHMNSPLARMRKSVGGLLAVMPSGEDVSYKSPLCSTPYLEIKEIFNSTEFRRYRESFGKLSLMVREKGIEGDHIFENFVEILRYYDKIRDGVALDGKIKFLEVASFYTLLGVMEKHEEVIDDAFQQH